MHRVRRDDVGFTLIELMFAMVLFGLLIALAVPGWRKYQTSQEQSGTARDLVTFLRDAQVRAVSEETSFKAVFANDGKSVTLQRLSGSTWSNVDKATPNGSSVSYSSPSFTQSDGSTASYVIFYARGAATPGSVVVTRSGNSKTYTVTVEGLTGRVSE